MWYIPVIMSVISTTLLLWVCLLYEKRLWDMKMQVINQRYTIEDNQNYKNLYEKEHAEYRAYVECAISDKRALAEKDAVISDLQQQLDDYY